MRLLRSTIIFLACLVLAGTKAQSCTVFFAFDGKLAVAASNEDWADPNTQIWFVPASKDNYGIVYFGFGRGTFPPGGISRHELKIPAAGITKINPEDLYGLAQGGMNDKGLFFDGAATDVVVTRPAVGKQAYDGRLEDLILRKCATVDDVQKILDTYAFNSVQGQWMFADKTGDSVIVEAGDIILRKKGKYQLMTNFHQSKVGPEQVSCPRYKLVKQSLAENTDVTVDGCRSLLKATAQSFTIYSTIFDLTNGEVYVHHRGDFERTVKLDLMQELGKGERAMKIADLFKP
jgi:hypothetical protein